MASDSEAEEVPSTSSDEEYGGRNKRGQHKYYEPSDSAESGDSEDGSEANSEEEDVEEDTGLKSRGQHNRPRKKATQATAPSQGPVTKEEVVDLVSEADEDEELQRALALSLAQPEVKGDSKPEEAIQPGKAPAAGQAKKRKAAKEGADGAPSAAKKGRRKFAAPSSADVRSAFQMLDPRGTGTLDPYALRDVAKKLLHNELSDADINALMEFAEVTVHQDEQEGSASQPNYGAVDMKGFERLVAYFSR